MGMPQHKSRRKSDLEPLQTLKPSSSSTSPFTRLTTSLYVSLSPCANAHPLPGLCAEHLSPYLMTYYAPLHGVLLSYTSPRISSTVPSDLSSPPPCTSTASDPEPTTVLARSIDEYAVTFLWLTASFLVFRPERGTILEGTVNVQNEGMVGLLCYNYFNVAIPAEEGGVPEGWSWDGEGWRDGEGEAVSGGGGERRWRCRVEDFVASGTEGLSIRARLVGG